MSKAFTKEEDGAGSEPLPDREISPHPNLVTPEGLAAIEANVTRFEAELSAANAAGDKEAAMSASRELRYWSHRRGSAMLVSPPQDSAEVRFGSAVTIERAGGRRQRWRITGEDEADPKQGTLSHVSPLARALIGRCTGDEISVSGATAVIIAIE